MTDNYVDIILFNSGLCCKIMQSACVLRKAPQELAGLTFLLLIVTMQALT